MDWARSRPGAGFTGTGFRAGSVRPKPHTPTGHHQWAASQRGSCNCGKRGNANIHLSGPAAVCDSGWLRAGMGMFRLRNQRLAFARLAAVAAACPAGAGTCPIPAAAGCLSAAGDGGLSTTVSVLGHLHDSCSRDCRPGIQPIGGTGRSGDQCDGQDCKRSHTEFSVSTRLLRASRISAMVI
jgi:hypothetical protein